MTFKDFVFNGTFLLPWAGYAEHFSEPFSLDGYEPRLAHDVVTRVAELSHDGYVLVLSFMIDVARMEAGRN